MSQTKLAHSYSALKQFDNCPKQYHMQRITKEVKPSFGEAALHGQRVHEELEAALKGEGVSEQVVKYQPLLDAFTSLPGEVLAEQEMTLNDKLEPTGWWDKDAWLRSKIDVLVLNGPDAVVADWKTGKHRPDFFQMELFAIQVFKHYPDVQKVKTSLVWLKDMMMDTEVYSRADAPDLWNKFYTKIHRIEAALETSVWPAKPSGLCPWCPAKHLCEFARI
jgi:hypothetical protein